MSRIRWGVLGTAKIGREKVIPATQTSATGVVTAIASRELSNAQAVGRQLGIEKAYGSYEELLADPDIDAVYIPLPNHLHVSWSLRAIAVGKHVLCEKPIGLSVAEAEQLAEFAAAHPQVKVMEAFMYRFHPQWIQTRDLVREGRIGELSTIQTGFSYFNNDVQNIRNQLEIGGGALMDIGCYPISLSRFIFGGEPTRVLGQIERHPQTKVDRLTSAVMEFGAGTSTFTCSTQMASYQRVNIFGTTGRIEIEIPFNAPPDRPCRMWLQAKGASGDQTQEINLPVCNQYTLQADAFGRAILDETPVPTPLADAVANTRVIERVFASAERGEWS
ncbi:MAG TPA: Gfo/Idh/MocA family oxidoreductase [Lacipirellulaceae bacterium]|nr:Gfo/Idh/MocA family oxidoreductase [Lacipirellulaceae bacterium]